MINDLLTLLGWVVACGAYIVGYVHGKQKMREQVLDTIEQIQPSSRTPGQPTNVGQPWSRVSEPRWRRRMLKDD
jgi:hypothetical protein